MTLGEINTKVLALIHSDSTLYTDPIMLIDINMWYEKIVSMILESQDDTNFDDNRNTNYPVATRLLVAGQRDYAFNTAAWTLAGREGAAGLANQTLLPLKIKRLDITYDGTNWFRATPFDDGVPFWGFGNATNEDSNFIQQAPSYGVKYNSLFVYPLATASNVTSGAKMRVEFERAVTVFSQAADYPAAAMSTSTTVPGIDLPFHPMIAYGAAYEWANANNLPQLQNIKNDLVDWEARLRQAYGRKDLDTVMSLQPAYDNYGQWDSWGTGGFYGR